MVLGSLVLAIKTAQVYKDKEIILSQIQVRGPAGIQTVKPMTDSDLITARQMVEGYAALYSLPVEVTLEKREIRIKVSAPKQDDGEGAVVDEKGKYAVLRDYDNVVGFFTSLGNMPYPLDYKDFCVGADCPNVFDVSITPKNHEEQQPAKPAERKSATSSQEPAVTPAT